MVFFGRRRTKDLQHKLQKRYLEHRISKRKHFEKWYTPNPHKVKRRDTILKHHDITQLSAKEILSMKRDQIMDAKPNKRLEIIPQVIINFRHPGQTSVYRRTMHELYVCQCMPGYLGAHCQRKASSHCSSFS